MCVTQRITQSTRLRSEILKPAADIAYAARIGGRQPGSTNDGQNRCTTVINALRLTLSSNTLYNSKTFALLKRVKH